MRRGAPSQPAPKTPRDVVAMKTDDVSAFRIGSLAPFKKSFTAVACYRIPTQRDDTPPEPPSRQRVPVGYSSGPSVQTTPGQDRASSPTTDGGRRRSATDPRESGSTLHRHCRHWRTWVLPQHPEPELQAGNGFLTFREVKETPSHSVRLVTWVSYSIGPLGWC